MSGIDIKSVSSGASQTGAPKPVPLGTSGGKVRPDAGKISPAKAASIRTPNLDEVVQKLDARSRSFGRALKFQVDVLRGQSVIEVLDRDTGELIRQIPPEEMIALTKRNGLSDIQLLDDLV